jgi:uncharacterized protein (DUF885 family)
MPVPSDIPQLLQQATQNAKAGRTKDALAAASRVEKWVQQMRQVGALNHEETVYVLAPLGTLLHYCKDLDGAARCKELVCELALQYAPSSTETLGDICQLAEVYKAAARPADALRTFERARGLAVAIAPQYLGRLDAEIATLRKTVNSR